MPELNRKANWILIPRKDKAPDPDLCVPRQFASGSLFTRVDTLEFALIWYGHAVSNFRDIRAHVLLPLISILMILISHCQTWVLTGRWASKLVQQENDILLGVFAECLPVFRYWYRISCKDALRRRTDMMLMFWGIHQHQNLVTRSLELIKSRRLRFWFLFYSSKSLILYQGEMISDSDAKVRPLILNSRIEQYHKINHDCEHQRWC